MDNSLAPSRRQVLAVAAATVTLPMISSAVGSMRSARAAAAASAPATEAAGWFTTKLKAADLKDNMLTVVDGHKILVLRVGKTVVAMTSVCTHKGCAVPANKPDAKTAICPCHKAEYNLDGTNAKGPAMKPLVHYAIRVNTDGLIEIDPGTQPAKDDKTASVTLS